MLSWDRKMSPLIDQQPVQRWETKTMNKGLWWREGVSGRVPWECLLRVFGVFINELKTGEE